MKNTMRGNEMQMTQYVDMYRIDTGIVSSATRLSASRMKAVSDLARVFGLPDPFDTEDARVSRVIAKATPPVTCGPDIIAAPARGTMIAFDPRSIPDSEAEGRHLTYLGRDAARAADAFDLMEWQARRRMGAEYRPLFSKGQVEAGRAYARVIERHDAGGIKLSSIEGRSGNGGGNGARDIADVRLAESRVIDGWHRAIGAEVIFKAVVGLDGEIVRRGLDARALVHMVCCQGMTVSQVVRRFGYHANGDRIAKARAQLISALDRMASGEKKGID